MRPNRFLIVGANSMIGSALMRRLRRDGQVVIGTTRRDEAGSENLMALDLMGDLSRWRSPEYLKTVFLCAGETRIEQCRRHPHRSYRVNVTSTIEVARRIMDSGYRVILLSTNLVFNGLTAFTAADSPVSPQCEYGRQKANAEKQLTALGGNAIIVRLTKVLDPEFFHVRRWRKQLMQHSTVKPFSDLRFSPISLTHVLDVLLRLTDHAHHGVWQLSGDCDVSYADFARFIAVRAGVERAFVKPITVAFF